LTALARQYHDEGPPKGEIVVVVAPPGAAAPGTEEELDARLAQVLETASLRDAVAQVAAELDLPRRRVYARALTLGQRDGGTS
jgi:16S rRNA (cytidine1402-2'-O)-methyltransferase